MGSDFIKFKKGKQYIKSKKNTDDSFKADDALKLAFGAAALGLGVAVVKDIL